MPRLEKWHPRDLAIISASIGGSALFENNQEFNQPTLNELLNFFRHELLVGHTIIAVVGGGPEARLRRDKAIIETPSITDDALDQIGIQVTKENALLLAKVLTESNYQYYMHDFGAHLEPGTIYVRGGTKPGHTTDYVAIQAARDAGQKVVLNISKAKGLHPIRDGHPIPNRFIPETTWAKYIEMFPQRHSPGIKNVPIDPEAARLAWEEGMSVILVGPNAENLIKCINGEDFVGTIIHP